LWSQTKSLHNTHQPNVVAGPRAGQYLIHKIVPEGKKQAKDLAEMTHSVLEEFHSLETLEAVILDNTPVNTGHSGGLCACLERKLGRKLHMIGCLLHVNELPLKQLITKLDGQTVSGTKFSGPIGQQIGQDDLHTRDVVAFEPVTTSVIRPAADILHDLSNDQRLLLEYMLGISSGTVAENFIKRRPGPLNHARWLTAAIRILMLYTRTVHPTDTLRLLVKYIQAVYGKVWFRVKQEKSFTRAPQILFDMMQDVKKIDTNSTLSNIVAPVLRRNAFSCLGENFLASLLYSDSPKHREIAVWKILHIREQPRQEISATEKHIPEINFDADNWGEMVRILAVNCQQPPCVSKLSDDDIKAMIASPGIPPAFPIHTQSVERAVKLTSEAARNSYVWEKSHQSIVAKNSSRKTRMVFKTKKDYK